MCSRHVAGAHKDYVLARIVSVDGLERPVVAVQIDWKGVISLNQRCLSILNHFPVHPKAISEVTIHFLSERRGHDDQHRLGRSNILVTLIPVGSEDVE